MKIQFHESVVANTVQIISQPQMFQGPPSEPKGFKERRQETQIPRCTAINIGIPMITDTGTPPSNNCPHTTDGGGLSQNYKPAVPKSIGAPLSYFLSEDNQSTDVISGIDREFVDPKAYFSHLNPNPFELTHTSKTEAQD